MLSGVVDVVELNVVLQNLKAPNCDPVANLVINGERF